MLKQKTLILELQVCVSADYCARVNKIWNPFFPFQEAVDQNLKRATYTIAVSISFIDLRFLSK